MENELRIILGVIGAAIIGWVIFDAWRRNQAKTNLQDQFEPIDDTTNSNDYDDISEVRVSSAKPISSEKIVTTKAKEEAVRDKVEPVKTTSNELHTSREDRIGFGSDSMDESVGTPRKVKLETKQPEQPELIFSLTLLAGTEEGIAGQELLRALVEKGCRFGEMNIFHRFKSAQNIGEKYFSVANAFNPGTFDIDTMSENVFKGITFFMTIPSSVEPEVAYKTMVETIRALKTEFNGQIKDGNRSVFTEQTYQHELEQIKEYKRKYLTKTH